MSSWKKIGKIGPPQGLGGSFFLLGIGSPGLPDARVLLGKDPSCGIPVTITQSRFANGQWLLKIRGIEERSALDAIRGQELWLAAQEELVPELVGTQILDAAGEVFGDIVDVINHGASDIAVIADPQKKQHIELPLIPDFFALPASDRKLELKVAAQALTDLWY